MKTQRPPKNPTQTWAWIIYQLSLRGSNLSAIARTEGVTRYAVYKASFRHYIRMEKAIAKALDLTPCQLWPNRYPECARNCIHHSEQTKAVQ